MVIQPEKKLYCLPGVMAIDNLILNERVIDDIEKVYGNAYYHFNTEKGTWSLLEYRADKDDLDLVMLRKMLNTEMSEAEKHNLCREIVLSSPIALKLIAQISIGHHLITDQLNEDYRDVLEKVKVSLGKGKAIDLDAVLSGESKMGK